MMSNLMLQAFIGIFLGAYFVFCSHKEDVQEFFNEVHTKDIYHHMNKFNSSINQICKGYDKQFNHALEEVVLCGERIDDEAMTYCHVVLNNLKNCTKPLVNVFEECLPETLKNWPSFIIDMVLSVTKYLCKVDGAHIIELANPCLKNTNAHTVRCVKMFKKKFELHGYDNLPTTQDFCRITKEIQGCFRDHVIEGCHDNITRNAFIRFSEELLRPCNFNDSLAFVEKK